MPPQEHVTEPAPHKDDAKKPHKAISSDPTKSTRSLTIALLVSAVFLLAAAGVVVWLVVTNSGWLVSKSITVVAPNDTKNVKSVTLVAPAALPATYVENDQSTRDATNIYYYDDAANCGVTVGVLPVAAGKTIKDIVVSAVTAAAARGVTTAKSVAGETYTIKDTDGSKTYTFDSVVLDQDVHVDGVSFARQNNIIAYKEFGSQVASISFSCKSDIWEAKKAELASLITQFTAKTER